MILVDTNIVISFIQNDAEIMEWIDARRALGERFAISVLTIVELFSYPKRSTEDETRITQWLERVFVIDVNPLIAHEAAQIRAHYRLTTVDSVLAATAVRWGIPLVSRDAAFQKIIELTLLVP